MGHDGWDPVCDLVTGWHQRVGRRRCVAVGGGVASGKSSVADRLAARSTPDAVVVAADDFLRSNAELEERGWSAAKGRPHTYDVDALASAVGRLMAGAPVEVPVYSHRIYDVVAGERRLLEPAELVLVEGQHVLGEGPLRPLVDLGVFIDTAEEIAHRRYLERIDGLVEAARSDRDSFYSWAVDLDAALVRSIVDGVWNDLNAVTRREDVEPTKRRADLVVSVDARDRMTLEIGTSMN